MLVITASKCVRAIIYRKIPTIFACGDIGSNGIFADPLKCVESSHGTATLQISVTINSFTFSSILFLCLKDIQHALENFWFQDRWLIFPRSLAGRLTVNLCFKLFSFCSLSPVMQRSITQKSMIIRWQTNVEGAVFKGFSLVFIQMFGFKLYLTCCYSTTPHNVFRNQHTLSVKSPSKWFDIFMNNSWVSGAWRDGYSSQFDRLCKEIAQQ